MLIKSNQQCTRLGENDIDDHKKSEKVLAMPRKIDINIEDTKTGLVIEEKKKTKSDTRKKTSEVMVMIVSGSLDMRLMTQLLSSAHI